MFKSIFTAALLVATGSAFAHNYGAAATAQLGGAIGSASSSSATTGGSQFGVTVNANGKADGYAESTGGGTALAGVKFTSNDVKTTTANTSYATGDAKSNIKGSATGTGSAAQGTDTASNASAGMVKFGVFGSFGVH